MNEIKGFTQISESELNFVNGGEVFFWVSMGIMFAVGFLVGFFGWNL